MVDVDPAVATVGLPASAVTGDDDRRLAVTMAVGESRDVELSSLRIAGYVWTHELEGDEGIVGLSRRHGPTATPPEDRSTSERLLITATAPGRVLIRMRQTRPWESWLVPRAHLTIDVQVLGEDRP